MKKIKIRSLVMICALVLALCLSVFVGGCFGRKADDPATLPANGQSSAPQEPIQSNPVETYVEPEE